MSSTVSSLPTPRAVCGVQELVWELIDRLGEDPARDGLFDTPERVELSLRFREHPEELLRGASSHQPSR
jgi:GTP cyclohydrolase I